MANLIIVSGPQAVGKMTVARIVAQKMNYTFMKNHDSIELSDEIFGRGTPAQKEYNQVIRKAAFDMAIKHDLDMVFTYVCAYNLEEDIEYLNNLKQQFEATGGKFYFVELYSDLETRLKRNITEERLKAKPSKRDIEKSNEELLRTAKEYRLNSNPDEFIFDNHYKIDNSNLEPEVVADMIVDYVKMRNLK